MSDTRSLITRLMELPAELEQARKAHLDALTVARGVEAELKDREAAILFDPDVVNGKNAEQREAQVRLATVNERMRAEEFRRRASAAEAAVASLQDQLRALTAVTNIWSQR